MLLSISNVIRLLGLSAFGVDPQQKQLIEMIIMLLEKTPVLLVSRNYTRSQEAKADFLQMCGRLNIKTDFNPMFRYFFTEINTFLRLKSQTLAQLGPSGAVLFHGFNPQEYLEEF
jgi:hypothetical protein